jgi:hypothetical protein
MSGVIDEHGQQWEHCSVCTGWVRIEDLGYEPPSPQFTCGRDICLKCTNAHPDIERIKPSPNWVAQYE